MQGLLCADDTAAFEAMLAAVPELVAQQRRQRAFSIFYTGGVGAGALAPVLYGFASDLADVPTMMLLVAAVVLVTLPLAWPSLVAGAILCWARALSELGATLVFAGNFSGRTQTMPLAIIGVFDAGKSVDVGHDLARLRDLGRLTRRHEPVL